MVSSVRNADPAKARASLSEARLQRSEYLISITEGYINPIDLIESAATVNGRPLRRITLRQLLLAQPRVGETRCRAYLSAVAETLETPEDLGEKTVAWLLDPRCGGRRFLAWVAAAQDPKPPVAPGWPLAMLPGQGDPQ